MVRSEKVKELSLMEKGEFIPSLFIIAETWKHARCPSVGEWINKLWYIKTMEFCSAIKRNELSSYKKTCRKLKFILLSERSQSEMLRTI